MSNIIYLIFNLPLILGHFLGVEVLPENGSSSTCRLEIPAGFGAPKESTLERADTLDELSL